MHLQPGGYGYGRCHIRVMLRYVESWMCSSREMKPCDFLSTACARTKVCRHLAWRCPRAWVSKYILVEAPGYTASGRGQLAHRARTWPAQSVSHVAALCGLFLPPRARDQTQSVLLGPKNAARPRKSRRGLDLQPGGYDYGKPHILVRIRFRGRPTSTSKASPLQILQAFQHAMLLARFAPVGVALRWVLPAGAG